MLAGTNADEDVVVGSDELLGGSEEENEESSEVEMGDEDAMVEEGMEEEGGCSDDDDGSEVVEGGRDDVVGGSVDEVSSVVLGSEVVLGVSVELSDVAVGGNDDGSVPDGSAELVSVAARSEESEVSTLPLRVLGTLLVPLAVLGADPVSDSSVAALVWPSDAVASMEVAGVVALLSGPAGAPGGGAGAPGGGAAGAGAGAPGGAAGAGAAAGCCRLAFSMSLEWCNEGFCGVRRVGDCVRCVQKRCSQDARHLFQDRGKKRWTHEG